MDITEHAPEYREKGIALDELFKPKEHCFMLANPHYGFQAEVSGGLLGMVESECCVVIEFMCVLYAH